ncbi:MAG: alpha/beta hydrolase [Sphingomonas sp.]|nr:MAG: alpha/beta hydrolase [Sphingomonas sp.]
MAFKAGTRISIGEQVAFGCNMRTMERIGLQASGRQMTKANSFDARPWAASAAAAVPLVLLPGTLCDARLFEPMLAGLSLGDRAVVNARYDGARTVNAAVEQLLVTLPPRSILLGFSLGGIVALALARAAPQRVAGLILVGTTARPVEPAAQAARRADVASARATGLDDHVRTALMPHYFADPADRCHDARLLAMACDVDRFDDETALALSRDDARPWLGDLLMPVLIVGGTQDRINPPAVQLEMADALHDASFVLLAGAGHFTPLERPEALAGHVATWLARIERYGFLRTQEEQR